MITSGFAVRSVRRHSVVAEDATHADQANESLAGRTTAMVAAAGRVVTQTRILRRDRNSHRAEVVWFECASNLSLTPVA